VTGRCCCYLPQNLSVPRLSRYLRMALVRLVVLCILLACAGAVTKLMAMNMEAARSVVWDNAAMDSMINIRMRVRLPYCSRTATATGCYGLRP
jgi:hypothetical protein